MQAIEMLQDLRREIIDLKMEKFSPVPEWIPRTTVMEFFNYGNTQMCLLEKTQNLVVTKVGNRKFIKLESVRKLLDANIQSC